MKFWNIIKKIGDACQSPFLLLIRLYWGYQFAITGFGKFLNLESIAGYFQELGIPFPHLNAMMVGGTELIGGILLFLGLFSRIAAIPLFVVMFMAYVIAYPELLATFATHFDLDPIFSKAPFLFALASLIIFCFGPGKFSLDYWLTGAYKNKQMP